MYYLVNYANGVYQSVRKINTDSGLKKAGFDHVFEYSEKDIPDSFKNKHKQIMSVERGNGLWLWKPYIMLDAMNKVNYGDIVFYCDSAAFFRKSMKLYLSKIKEDILVYELPLLEKEFTYASAFQKLGLTSSDYTKTNQILASFFAIKKSDATVKFVQEWLEYCSDIDLLYPAAALGDMFHREDQSLLSLICKKYSIKPHRDISQFGKFPILYLYHKNWSYNPHDFNEKVQFLICHHRKKSIGLKWKLIAFVFSIIPEKFMTVLVKMKRHF